MTERIRAFLAIGLLVFASAAFVHSGIVFAEREDPGAAIAESVIGLALVGGLVASLVRPAWTLQAALATQAFALLGTCVGLTLVLTVGPRTAVDIAYHVAMLVLLVLGLWTTIRASAFGSSVPA